MDETATSQTATPESATPEAGPRLRWGRIAALHFPAAAIVSFLAGFSIVRNPDYPQDLGSWISVGVFAALVGGTVTGGLTLLGARVAHAIVARRRRGVLREVVAVIVGSTAGAALIGLFLLATTRDAWTLVAIPVLGLAAGVGLAIWVLVAWRGRRRG
jgi:hypothetical protein